MSEINCNPYRDYYEFRARISDRLVNIRLVCDESAKIDSLGNSLDSEEFECLEKALYNLFSVQQNNRDLLSFFGTLSRSSLSPNEIVIKLEKKIPLPARIHLTLPEATICENGKNVTIVHYDSRYDVVYVFSYSLDKSSNYGNLKILNLTGSTYEDMFSERFGFVFRMDRHNNMSFEYEDKESNLKIFCKKITDDIKQATIEKKDRKGENIEIKGKINLNDCVYVKVSGKRDYLMLYVVDIPPVINYSTDSNR